MTHLGTITVTRRTGEEPFHTGGRQLGFELRSFWSWACSTLSGNALRGLIAEYLVAQAVGAADGVRTEWDACDVVTRDGTRIEVKSSAYVQSWKQAKLSTISFDIGMKRGWDAVTNTMATVASRSADVYVFAVHAHRDKSTLDPLDVAQWEFYVLPTRLLDERCLTQKRIGLSSLIKLGPRKVAFEELGAAIAAAAPGQDHGGP